MSDETDYEDLLQCIEGWARDAGFDAVGIADLDLTEASARLDQWLDRGYQADMGWMETQRDLRRNPGQLVPGALRAICFRMNYLPEDTQPLQVLENSDQAYIARYALGRDYHKGIRKKLASIAEKIRDWAQRELQQRPFVDSAPVLEKPLATRAGLGWIGKNTLLLNRDAGSWFFLGEILTDLPLPPSAMSQKDECGKCKACMTCCPTDAFPEPYVLDASRCISWLTIENSGPIPEPLRKPMGNRIFGCDDCQLVCPWNRFARHTDETDFRPRHNLDQPQLVELFGWSRDTWEQKTAGSAIRRTGYEGWQRNLAVALGNSSNKSASLGALANWQGDSQLVREHIEWAINQLQRSSQQSNSHDG